MKRTSALLLPTLTAAAALPLFLLAPGRASRRQKETFIGLNCAHRGLHSPDRSVPENSLPAFRLAAESGYGIELDVQLSRDGQVVVFHDDTLNRVCGVDARVEDLDYAALKKLSLCGTAHTIPLFTEVLALVKGRSPLIVELKTGRRNAELCRKTRDTLDHYDGVFCIESFDPTIVRWFKRYAPDFLRGQLAMPAERYADNLKPAMKFFLSRCLTNVLCRPQFIAYDIGPTPLSVRLAERMGAMRVGWTSHSAAAEHGRDTVIFEYYLPRARFK